MTQCTDLSGLREDSYRLIQSDGKKTGNMDEAAKLLSERATRLGVPGQFLPRSEASRAWLPPSLPTNDPRPGTSGNSLSNLSRKAISVYQSRLLIARMVVGAQPCRNGCALVLSFLHDLAIA